MSNLLGGIQSIQERIANDFQILAAPVSRAEREANLQVNNTRNHYSRAADNLVIGSVYSMNNGTLNAPTIEAKIGHNVDIRA